jgi:hypothetical protein
VKPIRRYSSIVGSTGVGIRGPHEPLEAFERRRDLLLDRVDGQAEHVRVHEGGTAAVASNARRQVSSSIIRAMSDAPLWCATAPSRHLEDVARIRDRRAHVGRHAREVLEEVVAGDREEERVRPVEHAREAVAGGSRHREPGGIAFTLARFIRVKPRG